MNALKNKLWMNHRTNALNILRNIVGEQDENYVWYDAVSIIWLPIRRRIIPTKDVLIRSLDKLSTE